MPAKKKTDEAMETVALDTEAALENGFSEEEIEKFKTEFNKAIVIADEVSDQWGEEIVSHLADLPVAFSKSSYHLRTALQKVQVDLGIGGVFTSGEGKVGKGGARSYDYAKKEDIVARLKPLLIKYGILWMQFPFGKNKFGNLLMKNNEFHWFACDMPVGDAEGTSSSQEWGKAVTYISRYTALAIFVLSPGKTEDDDGGLALSEKPSFIYLTSRADKVLALSPSDSKRKPQVELLVDMARHGYPHWEPEHQKIWLNEYVGQFKQITDPVQETQQPVATNSATQQQVAQQPVAEQQAEQTAQQRVKQNVEQIQNNTQRRNLPNAR